MEATQYVEKRESAYKLVGSRVSLDSIVHQFLSGLTAEDIARSFPVLSLEQVYGAIAFYLANRPEVDAYLEQGRADLERQIQEARQEDPEFYRRFDQARLRQSA